MEVGESRRPVLLVERRSRQVSRDEENCRLNDVVGK